MHVQDPCNSNIIGEHIIQYITYCFFLNFGNLITVYFMFSTNIHIYNLFCWKDIEYVYNVNTILYYTDFSTKFRLFQPKKSKTEEGDNVLMVKL